MSEVEIQVHVRQTGEIVTVPVIPLSTSYGEILREVCSKIKQPHPENYYLAWRYEIELENDHLFQPEHLNGTFQMIMRTKVLIEYIARARLVKPREYESEDVNVSTPAAPEITTEPTTKTNSPSVQAPAKVEARKSILSDVVQSAIAKIPQEDVQKYLHEAVGKSFDILLLGSPRVGKSTLINAILRKDVAKVGSGRNRETREGHYYEYKETYTTVIKNNQTIESTCSIRIRDAPGIEDWTKFNARQYFQPLLHEANPICLIYCASPGAYAEVTHLPVIIEECKALKLFVALVVTNMYASDEADHILEIFRDVLSRYSPQTNVIDHVYYYGNIGLCTQVNSVEFKFEETTMKPTGVDELMIGIMQSLTDKKMLQWCFALMDNGPFWVRAQATVWKWISLFKNFFTN